jgi:hypothetical protein
VHLSADDVATLEPTVKALHVTAFLEALEAGGRAADVLALYEEELRIREVSLGPQHPRVAETCANLGRVRGVPWSVCSERLSRQRRSLHVQASTSGPWSCTNAHSASSPAPLPLKTASILAEALLL